MPRLYSVQSVQAIIAQRKLDSFHVASFPLDGGRSPSPQSSPSRGELSYQSIVGAPLVGIGKHNPYPRMRHEDESLVS